VPVDPHVLARRDQGQNVRTLKLPEVRSEICAPAGGGVEFCLQMGTDRRP
jgi:hypothetical protein